MFDYGVFCMPMRSIELSTRRQRKKLDTRQRILREAAKLFDEKGFAAATVDEIVARADLSKGTFFNYFGRKDDLLLSVIERRLGLAESSAAEILSLAIPVRDQLLAIFSEAAHAWEEDREWSRHVLQGIGTRALAADDGARMAGRWRELIRRCVEQGQKSGEFRAGLSPTRVEALLSAAYHDALARWGARPEFELQVELREVLLLVLDGLGEP